MWIEALIRNHVLDLAAHRTTQSTLIWLYFAGAATNVPMARVRAWRVEMQVLRIEGQRKESIWKKLKCLYGVYPLE
jgi:hypothetical protein